MSEHTKPNFFVIGAPKCGTTALCEYLSTHPEVHFSNPKEPKYFHTDFHDDHRYAHTLEEYLRCFDAEEMRRSRAVGEGTVWYLYSRVAVRRILDFNPAAKLVVMVRNPVDLAYSLHAQLLYGGDEDVVSFERAWRLQARRRQGLDLPRHCRDPKALQYGAVARVGEQLERVYEQVPAERVQVVVFDDFKRETADVYRQVVEFLQLSPDDRHEFPIVNPSREVRFRPGAALLYLASSLKRSLGIRRSFGAWRVLSPLVSRRRARRSLSPDLRRELESCFRADVEKLSRLLDRDLTTWQERSEP